ncbi:MAG: metalloprotease [archaeon]
MHKQPFILRTSQTELQHILIAWLCISVCFAFVRVDVLQHIASLFSLQFIMYLFLAGLTGGVGFLLHELAHKIVAQKYGCLAEFRADFRMLLLGLVISIFGFVIAAPGAVFIFGKVTRRENGIIAVWGPLVNIILAFFFLPFIFAGAGFLYELGKFGMLINAWLALFNMLPISVLDGKKVWDWNKLVFFATITVAAVLVFFSFAIFMK